MASQPSTNAESPLFGRAEQYASTEPITGAFSRRLIQQAGLDKADGSEKLTILDLACGTGACTAAAWELLSTQAKANLSVTCGDLEDAMVDYVRQRITSQSWKGAEVMKLDAQVSGLPSNQYTNIFFTFGPAMLPSPSAGLKECLRLLRPGGTLALATWSKVGWYALCKEVLTLNPAWPVFPDEEEFTKMISFGTQWHDPSWVTKELEGLGMVDVLVENVEMTDELMGSPEFVELMVSVLPSGARRFWPKSKWGEFGNEIPARAREVVQRRYGGGEMVGWNWGAVLATARKSI